MAPHSTLYQVPGRAPAPVAAAATELDGLRAAVGRRLPPGLKAAVKRAARKVAGNAGAGAPGAAAAPAAPSADDHWSRINRIHAELVAQGRGGRASYTWSLLHAGDVARTLGIPRITAIEFGVAGGNGLVALEAAADAVVEHLGVGVDVVGFDHGTGLPPPEDYRDAPYLMEAGQFPMDEASLRARLRHASLHLGLVRDTVGPFLASDPAPVGFVAFDLDYYSSTMDAFRLFDAAPERFLPRVLCYFDDILGYPWGESNGPRLAIRHFNEAHEHRVLDFLPGLRYSTPPEEFHARWVECMYVAHVLDHPRKDEDEGVAIVTRLDLT